MMAKGSATSAMGGQSSSRITACMRAGSSSSPVTMGCRTSSSASLTAPSALAPSPSGHEGERPCRLLVRMDLVNLKHGLLWDEVHAALAPCRGR
jgi:hypothetical protein